MEPRRWIGVTADRRGEQGQATTILLLCMIMAILGVTMLFMRIGHANDLRTRAREAADAAALAAVTTVRDDAARMIVDQHIAPTFVLIGDEGKVAANQYAQQNQAVVTQYQGSGNASLVSVRTQNCVRKQKKSDDAFRAEQPCVRSDSDNDQTKDGQRTATATSAAVVDMPYCFNQPVLNFLHRLVGYRIMCSPPGGGQPLNASTMSFEDVAERLFKVHLSDSFNPTMFNPLAAGGSVPKLPPASAPERRRNELLGQQLAKDTKGWEGAEWGCLDQLWLHESGWDEHADNPSSDAYGIPQALPGSKMATAGSDWQTNPKTQIRWGLDYIAGRYNDPCNAWAQWQARNPHWY